MEDSVLLYPKKAFCVIGLRRQKILYGKEEYVPPTLLSLERTTGFEPATLGLGSRCSTAELCPPIATVGILPLEDRQRKDIRSFSSSDFLRFLRWQKEPNSMLEKPFCHLT